MSLLKGKRILITGISSTRSIAFGIAKAMYAQKANLGFVCQNEKIKNKIKHLVKPLGSRFIFSCDVNNDANIKKLFVNIQHIWEKFDGLVHSIAYCPKQYLSGDFIDNITREGFQIAHETSSYSFLGLVKESRKMLNNQSSLLTLSFLGSKRVIPNYNIMGLSKASLEANVRYMAYTLGKSNIRVNAISCGPMKTISAYNINNFHQINNFHCMSSFIHEPITAENVGNVASFLLSNLSIGITGSIIYVDNGFNISNINSIE